MPMETREVPMQMRVALVHSVVPEQRTAEVVWSTGAAVRRMDWWTGEEYSEELSLEPSAVRMERLQNGAPLLDTHGTWTVDDVIGVVESAWLEPNQARAKVRFSKRAFVDPIFADVQDGILRNISVGYLVHQFRDITEKDSKQRRLLAIDWEPIELSLVPVGADPKAGVRAESKKNSCVIEVPEIVRSFEAEQLADRQRRGRLYRESFRR